MPWAGMLWLQARQPLAHSGMLVNIYFLPILPNIGFVLLTAGTLLVLVLIVATWAGAAVVGGWRTAGPRRSPSRSRVRTLTGWMLLTGVLAVARAISFEIIAPEETAAAPMRGAPTPREFR